MVCQGHTQHPSLPILYAPVRLSRNVWHGMQPHLLPKALVRPLLVIVRTCISSCSLFTISVPPAGPSVPTSPAWFGSKWRGAGQSNPISPVHPLPLLLLESVAFPLEQQLPVSRSLDLCIPYTFEIVELIAGSCWNITHRIPLPFFFLNSIVSGAPGASSTPCESWWKASSGLASMGLGAG